MSDNAAANPSAPGRTAACRGAPVPPPFQMGAAATVAGLTGAYLDGSFDLDGHAVSCALSMKSASACTAAYVSATASILLSLLLVAMQVRGASCSWLHADASTGCLNAGHKVC